MLRPFSYWQILIQNFIVSQVLYGILFALISPMSLYFGIAQSPHKMRGLMVWLGYAAYGIAYTITGNIKYQFNIMYYFIAMSVLVLIILIMFLILAKCYKLHVTENEVNVHLIAEEHYKRYMDQEVDYNRRWDNH